MEKECPCCSATERTSGHQLHDETTLSLSTAECCPRTRRVTGARLWSLCGHGQIVARVLVAGMLWAFTMLMKMTVCSWSPEVFGNCQMMYLCIGSGLCLLLIAIWSSTSAKNSIAIKAAVLIFTAFPFLECVHVRLLLGVPVMTHTLAMAIAAAVPSTISSLGVVFALVELHEFAVAARHQCEQQQAHRQCQRQSSYKYTAVEMRV